MEMPFEYIMFKKNGQARHSDAGLPSQDFRRQELADVCDQGQPGLQSQGYTKEQCLRK